MDPKDILKGNFQTQKDVTPDQTAVTLEGQYEREALKKLGGSIAFVSNLSNRRKKVLFEEDMNGPAALAPTKDAASDE